jgi:hypothetical protein
VVVLFFAISIGLVLVGAQRSLDPAPSVTIAAPGTPERPRAVTVIMRDYRFDPTPLVLIPGETIRLTVFNGGLVEHELALGEADFQQAAQFQRAQCLAQRAARDFQRLRQLALGRQPRAGLEGTGDDQLRDFQRDTLVQAGRSDRLDRHAQECAARGAAFPWPLAEAACVRFTVH